uniref:Interferon alpha inducible protein 27 like 1 n=1 Tax=Terrapene triunguis TaxID=2587831 RepID=A0A674IK38_9SAUR
MQSSPPMPSHNPAGISPLASTDSHLQLASSDPALKFTIRSRWPCRSSIRSCQFWSLIQRWRPRRVNRHVRNGHLLLWPCLGLRRNRLQPEILPRRQRSCLSRRRTKRNRLRRTQKEPESEPEPKSRSKAMKAAIGAGVGIGLAVIGAPVAIWAAGFTGAGIAAGSFAAKMMSAAAIANGGGVAAGSLVATLQSAGAVGLSLGAKVGLGTALGSVGAAVGSWFSKHK